MGVQNPTHHDRELVLRAAAGDSQAVADLYTRFWRAARASAYAVTGDMASAEDAAAEAFRIALPGMKKLRDPARFAPWLRRIVRRVATRHLDSAARDGGPPDDAVRSSAPDPADALQRRELALLVSQAVGQLPPAEREAIVLFYFEGYDGASAARFLDIPVGSLRRRLHDGRNRLRKHLTRLLEGRALDSSNHLRLRARVEALLASDASPAEWYDVMRAILFTRPVPHQVLASLAGRVMDAHRPSDFVARALALLVRPEGPLFEDPGAVGEAARVLRAALSEFQDWGLDVSKVLQTFPDLYRQRRGRGSFSADPELMPPGFSTGEPGRYVRATRGLLFGAGDDTVADPAELLVRSGSIDAFTQGARSAWLSDVLDVYWLEPRPIQLAEVVAWVTALADRIAPGVPARSVAQAALRYRSALRLSLGADKRPAAIGGVLAPWPGAPEASQAVHIRLYLEPWAQMLSGRTVEARRLRRGGSADPR